MFVWESNRQQYMLTYTNGERIMNINIEEIDGLASC